MEACKEDSEIVNKNKSVSIKVTNRHAFDCCNCSAFLTNIPVFQVKKCSPKLQSCPKNIQRIALATISSEFLMIPFGYFGSSEPLKLEICITPMMQIYIMDLTGKRTPMRVYSSDTIVNVKLKILDKKRIPLHQQSLIFNHMQLDDRMTIADCNIKEKSTIHLMLRLTGN
ncbi:RING-type E3 ubiquitin transferase [Trifolium repens]|nr:RING-type E3 ubiquitin transferase [Trifolium repens]